MDFSSNKNNFLTSLSRCLSEEGFLELFYEKFIESDPEIKEKFRFTNLDRQVKMLASSLTVSINAIEGEPDGLAKLKELTVSHNRYHHNAKPEWYDFWLESLIETASLTDPQWSDMIEESWRKMLSMIIKKMVSGYEG